MENETEVKTAKAKPMSRKAKKLAMSLNEEIAMRQRMTGPNLSFAGAEAYKLLRTNLMLSISDSEGCKVIGVTSSIPGEGKSTTSLNLAYSLAETGKSVLLIEGDMRKPNVAKTVQTDEKPGLSNLLTGLANPNEAVKSDILEMPNFFIIPAGDIPPNPAELLSSRAMEKLMDLLKERFEYIVLDLPPIGAVSDGLAVSRLVTGMIVVVRENYCDSKSLNETLKQLELINVKVLGMVLNGSERRKKGYKAKGYGKYGDYYRYS